MNPICSTRDEISQPSRPISPPGATAQDNSHTKLGTFRSTTKALLITRAGTLIVFFQMKFKFSKKFQTVYDFTQYFCFF